MAVELAVAVADAVVGDCVVAVTVEDEVAVVASSLAVGVDFVVAIVVAVAVRVGEMGVVIGLMMG